MCARESHALAVLRWSAPVATACSLLKYVRLKAPVIEEHLSVVGNWKKGLFLCINKHKISRPQMSVLFHFPVWEITSALVLREREVYTEVASLLLKRSQVKKPTWLFNNLLFCHSHIAFTASQIHCSMFSVNSHLSLLGEKSECQSCCCLCSGNKLIID